MATPTSENTDAIYHLPAGLPQCFPVESQRIFVRDCYLEYYDMLLQLLGTRARYIVLTGTPGIGKSVFYMYFFDRYRAAFADKKILLAAFNKNKSLKNCVMWDPVTGQFETVREVPKDSKDDNCFLHLYDGVPPQEPNEDVTMVCFCSPDLKFLESLIKYRAMHRRRYMPNWTFREQQDARDTLKLKVTDKELMERWDQFGGTVRYPFESDQEATLVAERAVDTALANIKSMDSLSSCFDGTGDADLVVHKLMHYVVTSPTDFDCKLKPASTHIALQMSKKLDAKLDWQRAKLARWLDGAGKAGNFVGWIFENVAHEKLLGGLSTTMREIGVAAAVANFEIKATDGYTRFKTSVRWEKIFENAYRMPEATNLRSIDSYYLKNDELLLFQITRNGNHSVNLQGIIDILNELGVLQKFLQNKLVLKLVFVVPKNMFLTFPKQGFHVAPVFGDHLNEQAINDMPCTAIPGIAGFKKRKLDSMGVTDIGQLLSAYEHNPASFSSVRNVVTEFKASLVTKEHHQAIKAVAQFVCGLPYNVDHANGEDSIFRLSDGLGNDSPLRPYHLSKFLKVIKSEISKVHDYCDPEVVSVETSASLCIIARRAQSRLKNRLSKTLPPQIFIAVGSLCNKLEGYNSSSGVTLSQLRTAVQDVLQSFKKGISGDWTLRHELVNTSDVIYCTLCTSGSPAFCSATIDDLVVDEAAAATEPTLYIPLKLEPQRMLIVGDPKQLAAVVVSKKAKELGLSESLHERLMNRCGNTFTLLEEQYRMHPEISAFPSGRFYGGKISNGGNVMDVDYGANALFVEGGKPFVCYNVPGTIKQYGDNVENYQEAKAVVDVVESLSRQGRHDWNAVHRLRVITFYRGQLGLIERLLKERGFKGVLVATVDSSQGCEADVVIVSFVRGSRKAGFLKDDRRINVALTRAKHQLICIGNVYGLQELEEKDARTLRLLSGDAQERRVVVRNWPPVPLAPTATTVRTPQSL